MQLPRHARPSPSDGVGSHARGAAPPPSRPPWPSGSSRRSCRPPPRRSPSSTRWCSSPRSSRGTAPRRCGRCSSRAWRRPARAAWRSRPSARARRSPTTRSTTAGPTTTCTGSRRTASWRASSTTARPPSRDDLRDLQRAVLGGVRRRRDHAVRAAHGLVEPAARRERRRQDVDGRHAVVRRQHERRHVLQGYLWGLQVTDNGASTIPTRTLQRIARTTARSRRSTSPRCSPTTTTTAA